ncbi:MAG: two-component regulator propeller domain-containing protein, partial [Mucilaginibacter sp.]
MKRILLLILLLAGIKHSYAQSSHLKFDHFTVKDGLPERQIRFLKQDNEGYIWVGTQNGLLRYDGYKPKVYRFGVDKDAFYQTCSVESMIIDQNNTIWVSTFGNGLFRYDRVKDTFIAYKYPQKPGEKITYNQELALSDAKNNIWAFSFNFPNVKASVVKFNQQTQSFERFGQSEKGNHHIESEDFSFIYKTADSTIWLGSTKGLLYYDYRINTFHNYPLQTEKIRLDSIDRIYEAPSEKGIVWISATDRVSKKHAIVRLDTKLKSIKYYSSATNPELSMKNDSVRVFYEDKKHRLWMGTSNGLLLFDRKTSRFTSYIKTDTNKEARKNDIRRIVEAKNGTLWMSTGKGLLTFDPSSMQFQRYIAAPDEPSALNGNEVNSLMVDRSGSVFVAARRYGLNKNNPLLSIFNMKVADKNNPNGYPGGETIHFADTHDGYLLFTNPNGIYKWKPGSDRFEQVFKSSKTSTRPFSIATSIHDIIYFDSDQGFNQYNLKTHQLKTYKADPKDSTSISSIYITNILQDHLGIVWICTDDKGVCTFDPATGHFKRYPYISNTGSLESKGKLDDNRVISVMEDRSGTIWIGTNLGGLNRFDRKTGKFKSFLLDGNTRVFSVTKIFEDQQGMFWVSTYLNGLFKFNPHTGHFIRNINEDNGLLFNSINSFSQDDRGFLWVSSERGLTRIDPRTMALKNFKVNDVFPGGANDIGDSFDYVGGQLLLSMKNGIGYFNPDDLTANPYPPIVHIERVGYSDPRSATDSSTVLQTYGSHGIKLPYNQNRITFRYIALHFANPSQNEYAYRLEGYDKNWVQAGTLRSVTYTNLSPGTYTFRVKACNSDGVWNNEGDSFLVIVDSPLWMRWWAWVIYILLFAGAIYGFVTYRSRALIKEKRLLEEGIALRTTQLSDANRELSEQQEEITTQRDRLAETVDHLKTTQQQLVQSEKLASLGELTAGIAHEIQNPLNFVNNF